MTIEETNKAIFHRWFTSAWNAGDYDVADEIIAPTMLVHGAGGQPVEMGPAGLKGLISTWRTSFPDGHMDVDGVIAQGDLVAALLTWRGTQKADFYGVPASGASVVCTSVGIDRMTNGQVSDGWGELDMVGLMQQIGALPKVGPGTTATGGSAEWGASAGALGSPSDAPQSDLQDVAERFLRGLVTGDAATVDSLAEAKAHTVHDPVWGVADLAGHVDLYATLRAALPDLALEVDLVFGEGDGVAVHSVLRGTHSGAELYGTAASGKAVAWTQSDVFRVVEGRVVEHWVSADTLSLLQQVGVLPSQG